MAHVYLYGREYSIEEIRKRVGDMSQLAGIRSAVLQEGQEAGVRVVEFRTGSGFRFTLVPDRGLDIADAEWCGVPLVWHSPTGITHPAYYEPQGFGWLRSFYGGLMVTCGLMNVAVPSEDEWVLNPSAKEQLGLHGRYANIPARNVRFDCEWRGDDYVMWAKGKVRETRVFGENVQITRTITTRLGAKELEVEDVIENFGFQPTPLMILYHINAGFPVLDDGSELLINSQIMPRDEEAAKGLEVAKRGGLPTSGFKEQVYYHNVKPSTDGWAVAALVNRQFNNGQGIGIALHYRPEELPYFWQWRMLGEGTYVMGLEPANCHVMGRGEERRQGRLPFIQAGERKVHHLRIEVLTSQAEIARVEREAIEGGRGNVA